jgi:hypothetical protein
VQQVRHDEASVPASQAPTVKAHGEGGDPVGRHVHGRAIQLHVPQTIRCELDLIGAHGPHHAQHDVWVLAAESCHDEVR